MRARPVRDRLFEKIDIQENGCWNFTGHLNACGYGTISINNRSCLAHRAAYDICIGNIPEGINVLHSCDNPACINPEHLFLGTQADNVYDMCAKGRNYIGIGSECGNAILTESDVKRIRELISKGATQKQLAEHYKVSNQTISSIHTRTSWTHIS